MRIHLVRHGETAPNPPNSFYGGSEVPLSANGELQAAAAATYLADEPVDHIICSPLSRAVFGAEQVRMRHTRVAVSQIAGFREKDCGRWVGHDLASMNKVYPDDMQSYLADPINWRGHGGESLAQVQSRVISAFEDVLASGYSNIVIVSHLFPTRIILNHLTKGDAVDDLMNMKIPTASVSHLDYPENGSVHVGVCGHVPY
jgi:broad specificity phosphatase PhoE